MQVEILGTVGYHPTETRHTSCVLLPELGIVFDAGTAMFRLPERLQTAELDIFLSHTHLDHVAGLTFFFSITLKHPLSKITIHAEERKIAALQQKLFSPDIFPVLPPYEWRALEHEAAEITIRNAKITWFPLQHPGGSVGYRLDVAGRSMAFVTDTTATANADYIEHIRGVDLMLHECNFPDGHEQMAKITGHSCLTPVAKLAAQAAVKRVVLIHVDPVQQITPAMIEGAQAIFPALELSYDGLIVDF